MNLTREELREVIQEAVAETLKGIGIDEEDADQLRRDFAYLRDMRRASGTVKMTALLSLVGIVASGFATVVWLGFSQLFKVQP